MAGAVLDSTYIEASQGAVYQDAVPVREPIRWRVFIPFLLLLPLFAGSFSYVKNFRVLWGLTKAWPVVSLPLVLVLLWHERASFTRQLVITLTYMFLVPSFTGMYSFHQDFFRGLTSQVKLLPLLFFFSFLALLYLLRLNYREVQTAFLALSTVTFTILTALWALAPKSWYDTRFVIGEGSILTQDDRGLRIRMPMYFGIIGIFYCYRRFFAEGKWRWFLLTAFLYSTLIFAVKTRAFIVAVPIVLALNAFRFASTKLRIFLVGLIPIIFIGLYNVPLVQSLVKNEDIVRRGTTEIISEFLGSSLVRWTIGVGSISPLDPAGMIVYFNHFFYLADVTWYGVVFEFGLVGAVLFALIPLRGMWMSRKLQLTRDDIFLGSLQDYLIYAMVGSPMTAIILAPGELTVIIAVFVYFGYRMHTQMRRA